MNATDQTTIETADFAEIARLLVDAAETVADPTQPVDLPISSPPDDAEAAVRRLEELPRELGVLLASVGVLGFVLPGVAGTPALIAGGLVLWPKTFRKVEGWFSGRFPVVHRKSMQQVGRFLDDLDKRYPGSEPPSP
jgi:hypothetical protein